MKAQTRLILAVALTSALFASGCKRDNDSDEATTAATAATVAAPAEATVPPPAMSTAEPAPASTAAAPAATTTAPVDSGLAFAAMDKNGDGGISKDELSDTEMLYQHFSAADTDGNGKLSSQEVDTHRAEMAAKPGG